MIELKLNPCRILKYGHDKFFTFAYHLDKEAMTKSGEICVIQASESNLNLVHTSKTFEFGILSAKWEGD